MINMMHPYQDAISIRNFGNMGATLSAHSECGLQIWARAGAGKGVADWGRAGAGKGVADRGRAGAGKGVAEWGRVGSFVPARV